ncbi:anthranilate synthase component 2 [Sphingobacterium wenxiniae]|uniref:Anthranilate synthase component 2 n=2 Tax=Sphingobacterium wenxiniae TaxID=683125 RepID=A0A1I6R6U6_9SPHI|nr:anthranilate synthase component 2 [Sphingobacterium wenxiniae]
MIRPLDYCTELHHFEQSIETIEQRISELTAMKNLYLKKAKDFEEIDSLLKNEKLTEQMNNSKILVIDNYDSFTYNLVHLLQELGQKYEVVRNDKFELSYVDQFDKILLSPGPGIPEEAGLLLDVIRTYAPTKSILGICLGQQAIAEVFGGKLFNMPKPLHGVSSSIFVKDVTEKLFKNFPADSKIGRYHSWAVEKESLPVSLKITAEDENGVIMALSHTEYDVRGVQFHPESVLTDNGKLLIANWLK